MASPSLSAPSPVLMRTPAMNFSPYPSPLARYDDLVANPNLFMSTLEKFHASMGTKFMIPIIGGKDLDLHRLFVEVTSRGGIEKIIRERKWKEVTAVFNFPSTATNASFVLRKYYGSLLHHYEQLYFFKAQGWTPLSTVPSKPTLPSSQVMIQPSLESRTPTSDVSRVPSTMAPVIGVIDGKFEGGYLVTVAIGSEKLKGVLYEAPAMLPPFNTIPVNQIVLAGGASGSRRRRKKHEMKRRDPAHPKPNRSGYNFFFAEQHARLKPLHPGKDRDISRMIGELWNNLKDNERSVYQEKAMKDKERYKSEMEDYRERLRSRSLVSDAVPIQQWMPEPDVDMEESDPNNEGIENESTFSGSGSDDDKTATQCGDAYVDSSAGLGTEAKRDEVFPTGFSEPQLKIENPNLESIEPVCTRLILETPQMEEKTEADEFTRSSS